MILVRGLQLVRYALICLCKAWLAAASCPVSHPAVGLALVRLETKRKITATRHKLGLNFRGRGGDATPRESIFGSLHLLNKTKPSDAGD